MTITCKGCGACCFMGTPPIYGYYLFVDGGWPTRHERLDRQWQYAQTLPKGEWQEYCLDDWKEMKEDIARIEAMPAEAREAIVRFWTAMELGEADQDGPCCWLDPETKECRWYEYRPSICREFPMGGEGCRSWRKRARKAQQHEPPQAS